MVSHQGKWRIYAILAAILLPLCVEAQTPPMIHYQGRLFRSSTGEPEEGLKEFRFRMVNTEAGSYTKLYWGEDQDVLVANGFYEVNWAGWNRFRRKSSPPPRSISRFR
jgi:hypothetical protein